MTVNNNLTNISHLINKNFSLQEVFNKNAKETVSNLVTEVNALSIIASLLTKTNENVGSLVKGNVVYSSSLNNVNKAQANSINTSKVLGMVTNITAASNATATIQNSSVFAFDNTTQVDAIANTTGGFTFDTYYYLDTATAGTFYALLGIRLKPTHKDISVLIEKLSILSTSQDNFLYELRLNPTVAGTFTYSNVTDSSIQRAIGAGTNTVTGGTVLSSGLQQQQASANISTKNALRLGSTIAGVMDTFVLCVAPLSQTMTIHAAMDIRELF